MARTVGILLIASAAVIFVLLLPRAGQAVWLARRWGGPMVFLIVVFLFTGLMLAIAGTPKLLGG